MCGFVRVMVLGMLVLVGMMAMVDKIPWVWRKLLYDGIYALI